MSSQTVPGEIQFKTFLRLVVSSSTFFWRVSYTSQVVSRSLLIIRMRLFFVHFGGLEFTVFVWKSLFARSVELLQHEQVVLPQVNLLTILEPHTTNAIVAPWANHPSYKIVIHNHLRWIQSHLIQVAIMLLSTGFASKVLHLKLPWGCRSISHRTDLLEVMITWLFVDTHKMGPY